MNCKVEWLVRSHRLLVAEPRLDPVSDSRPVHPFVQQMLLTGPAPGTQDLAKGLEQAPVCRFCASRLTSTLPFQNKCVPYWPEVGTQRAYGPYTVTNCGEHDTAEYKLRTLQVSPLDNVSVPSILASLPGPLLGAALVSGWVGRGGVWEQRALAPCTLPRGTWFGRSGTIST